jgi:hypothetical protein
VQAINNVDIQLASALPQPQPANTVQRVTATVLGGDASRVVFKVTNLEGLELVGTSCRPGTREQALVKAGAINQCSISARQQRPVPLTDGDIVADVQPSDNAAWIELRRSTPGDTSVSIDGVGIDVPATSLSITGAPVPLVWSSLNPGRVLIGPKKAYRRCYEGADVVARVLDAGGAPVADQPVTFAFTGSCVPRLESSQTTVTDAHGYVHLSLTSSKPGLVVVVAATVGANGNALLSRPSNIVFEEEHRYEDREYEGRLSAQARGAARPDSRWVMMVAVAVGGLFDQDACSLCGTLDDTCLSALPACPPTRSCCCAAAVTRMSSTGSMQRTQPAWRWRRSGAWAASLRKQQ